MQKRNSSPPRKPWPMYRVVIAILLFISLYTFVSIRFRKEEAAHLPYESMRERSGEALQRVGWRPFPNAYGIAADAPEFRAIAGKLPTEEKPSEIFFEKLDRQNPKVSEWSAEIPSFEQGEQLQRIEAPESVSAGDPYFARLFWEAPEKFRMPQLIVFQRERSEEHTSELQSRGHLVCRLLLEKKKA